MISQRVARPTLGLAALLALGGTPHATAQSYAPGDYVNQPYPAQAYVATGRLDTVASRCADFGPGFIDMGGGICGRVGSSGRVQLGTRSANAGAWSSGGTTSATLRSDGMLPGARVQHLRIPDGLDQ